MDADIEPKASPANDINLSKGALSTFFRITADWELSRAQEETLLGVSRTRMSNWRSEKLTAPLDSVTLQRLSYVFRIYSALKILLPIPERANMWVKAVNAAPLFNGCTALDRMLAGQVGDLQVVADYLDSQICGDFS